MGLLDLLAFGDVEQHAMRPEKPTVPIPADPPFGFDEDASAILVDELDLGTAQVAHFPEAGESQGQSFDVLWAQEITDATADDFGALVSEQLQPGLVDMEDPGFGVQGLVGHRRFLIQQTEVLGHILFDVVRRPDRGRASYQQISFRRWPAGGCRRCRFQSHTSRCAVVRFELKLERWYRTPREQRQSPPIVGLATLRQDELRQGLPGQIRPWEAKLPGCGGVGIPYPVIGTDNQAAGRREFQQFRTALPGFRERSPESLQLAQRCGPVLPVRGGFSFRTGPCGGLPLVLPNAAVFGFLHARSKFRSLATVARRLGAFARSRPSRRQPGSGRAQRHGKQAVLPSATGLCRHSLSHHHASID